MRFDMPRVPIGSGTSPIILSCDFCKRPGSVGQFLLASFWLAVADVVGRTHRRHATGAALRRAAGGERRGVSINGAIRSRAGCRRGS